MVGAEWARDRFAASPVARLATVGAGGQPHLVPVVFAVEGDRLWTAVDGKPKSTRSLRRLANIAANPRVSLLVDAYDDDWSTLWWVRADGVATVLAPGSEDERDGVARLVARYRQYDDDPPAGPVIRVTVEVWRSWSAA
jgi:PPOX class probable F420-dependent enzyme